MGKKRGGEGGRGGGEGGGPGKSKRHKARFLPQGKSGYVGSGPGIPQGSRGFLVSCITGKEYACSREIIRLLTEFMEKQLQEGGTVAGAANGGGDDKKGEEKSGGEEGETGGGEGDSLKQGEDKSKSSGFRNIEQMLQEEVEDIKSKKQNPLHYVNCGVKSLIFVQMRNPGEEEGEGEKKGKGKGKGEGKGEEEKEEERGDGGEEKKEEEGEGEGEGEEEGERLGKVGSTETEQVEKEKKDDGASGGTSVQENGESDAAASGGKEQEQGSLANGGLQKEAETSGPSPTDIALSLLREAADTKQSRTKFTLRVIPVEVACYASPETIAQEIGPLVAKAFPKDAKVPSTFAIMIDARANNGFDKRETIKAVACLVPPPHKVDLDRPQITIMLEIVKTTCCMSILPSYKELAKFNLRQVAGDKEDTAKGATADE